MTKEANLQNLDFIIQKSEQLTESLKKVRNGISEIKNANLFITETEISAKLDSLNEALKMQMENLITASKVYEELTALMRNT